MSYFIISVSEHCVQKLNKYINNIRVVCVGHFGIPAHHRSRRLTLFSSQVLT